MRAGHKLLPSSQPHARTSYSHLIFHLKLSTTKTIQRLSVRAHIRICVKKQKVQTERVVFCHFFSPCLSHDGEEEVKRKQPGTPFSFLSRLRVEAIATDTRRKLEGA